MSINPELMVMGVAKQSSKGSLAANPAFAFGVADGGIGVDINQEPNELTSTKRSRTTMSRDKSENSAEIKTLAYVKLIGSLLLGALGNVSTTGAGPYVHVFTEGDTLPYLSIFEKWISPALIQALRDAKIDEFSIEWDENKPLEVSVKANGTVVSFPVGFTPGTDETDSDDYFTPVGGTFKLDVDSATPVTAAVKAGKITVKNGANPIFLSGSIEANDVDERVHEVEVSFTIVPTDFAEWRTTVTGTNSGSSVSGAVLYGSFENVFTQGTNSLKLESASCAFLCDKPTADPGGGYTELELSGACRRSGANSPLKATLTNGQATY